MCGIAVNITINVLFAIVIIQYLMGPIQTSNLLYKYGYWIGPTRVVILYKFANTLISSLAI